MRHQHTDHTCEKISDCSYSGKTLVEKRLFPDVEKIDQEFDPFHLTAQDKLYHSSLRVMDNLNDSVIGYMNDQLKRLNVSDRQFRQVSSQSKCKHFWILLFLKYKMGYHLIIGMIQENRVTENILKTHNETLTLLVTPQGKLLVLWQIVLEKYWTYSKVARRKWLF